MVIAGRLVTLVPIMDSQSENMGILAISQQVSQLSLKFFQILLNAPKYYIRVHFEVIRAINSRYIMNSYFDQLATSLG